MSTYIISRIIMLYRLRRLFVMSRGISALKQFSLSDMRNTLYPECRNGYQAWLDLPRSNITINNSYIEFDNIIKSCDILCRPLEGDNYRHTLHSILQQTLLQHSNVMVNPSVIDELITILHQGCLHGALYTTIMSNIAQDIQEMPNYRDTNPIAILNDFKTSIVVLSENTINIRYLEQASIKDASQDNIICDHINGEISFNITSHTSGVVSYNNANVSLSLPQILVPPLSQRILISLSNIFTRLKHFITKTFSCNNRPNNLTGICRIANTLNDGVLLLSTPSNTEFTTVTRTEILQQKETVGAYDISHDDQNKQETQTRLYLSGTTSPNVTPVFPGQQSRSL